MAHEHRTRLAVELPEVDARHAVYVPKDAPWLPHGGMALFIPIDVADGLQYQCPICGQRFVKAANLKTHTVTMHRVSTYVENIKAVTKAKRQVGIKWRGKPYRVPPEPQPKDIWLPSCPSHQWIMPSPSCTICCNNRLLPAPHPPVLFYEVVQMDVLFKVPGALPQVTLVAGDPVSNS